MANDEYVFLNERAAKVRALLSEFADFALDLDLALARDPDRRQQVEQDWHSKFFALCPNDMQETFEFMESEFYEADRLMPHLVTHIQALQQGKEHVYRPGKKQPESSVSKVSNKMRAWVEPGPAEYTEFWRECNRLLDRTCECITPKEFHEVVASVPEESRLRFGLLTRKFQASLDTLFSQLRADDDALQARVRKLLLTEYLRQDFKALALIFPTHDQVQDGKSDTGDEKAAADAELAPETTYLQKMLETKALVYIPFALVNVLLLDSARCGCEISVRPLFDDQVEGQREADRKKILFMTLQSTFRKSYARRKAEST
jgi:hypothetical protein